MAIFLMLVLGIFEYARFLFTLGVSTNAARDAARYAVVNVNNDLITGTAITNDPNTATIWAGRPIFNVADIATFCRNRMGGVDRMMQPRTGTNGGPVPMIQVFPLDTSTLYTNPPEVKPKKQPDSTASPPITVATWNNARFTERVAVRIFARYSVIAPVLLYMEPIQNLDITVVMGSEG
jgi:Flp pilus assembly protein TadG